MDQPAHEYAYEEAYDSLSRFAGTHPRVMQERLNTLNWHPQLSTSRKQLSLRYRMLYWVERHLGIRLFENKHFIERRRMRPRG